MLNLSHFPENVMRITNVFILCIVACIQVSCLHSEDNDTKPASKEQMEEVLTEALASPKAFQQELKETCPKYKPLLLEVAETIHMGSRIWNAGGIPITIRLYEGVAYRVLYELNGDCPRLAHAFQAGLNRAKERDGANSKGRALRETLDLIMGGPPAQPPGTGIQ